MKVIVNLTNADAQSSIHEMEMEAMPDCNTLLLLHGIRATVVSVQRVCAYVEVNAIEDNLWRRARTMCAVHEGMALIECECKL